MAQLYGFINKNLLSFETFMVLFFAMVMQTILVLFWNTIKKKAEAFFAGIQKL